MTRWGVVLTTVAVALLGLGQPATADPTLSVSVTGARLVPVDRRSC